jgi:hypothetical protein
MSNIPSTAIHAAFTPIQRATNDLLRARKVQADKQSHHAEDVEEIDDTAVSSVEERREGRQQGEKQKRPEDMEEKVEIAALTESPQPIHAVRQDDATHLDISA